MSTMNIFDLSDTWNAGGTTFSAIKMNVADTASAAASTLLDLQVNGTSQFHVLKSGVVQTKQSNYNIASANTSIITASNYSLTGSNASSMFELSGTWNTTGTPTAIKANITDTASNAASLLIDLQVSGSSKFNVTKDGVINVNGSPLSSGIAVAARQTANFNAVADNIYPVDTTSGVITATLPASPAQGDRIGFYDAAGTWDTNNLTIGRNGNNIVGDASDLVANIEWIGIMLAYDATRGWAIAT